MKITSKDTQEDGYVKSVVTLNKKEFNLSNEMNDLLSLNRFGKGKDNDEIYDLLKEFIRLLKEDIERLKINTNSFCKCPIKLKWAFLLNQRLDKLAGDKLF